MRKIFVVHKRLSKIFQCPSKLAHQSLWCGVFLFIYGFFSLMWLFSSYCHTYSLRCKIVQINKFRKLIHLEEAIESIFGKYLLNKIKCFVILDIENICHIITCFVLTGIFRWQTSYYVIPSSNDHINYL